MIDHHDERGMAYTYSVAEDLTDTGRHTGRWSIYRERITAPGSFTPIPGTLTWIASPRTEHRAYINALQLEKDEQERHLWVVSVAYWRGGEQVGVSYWWSRLQADMAVEFEVTKRISQKLRYQNRSHRIRLVHIRLPDDAPRMEDNVDEWLNEHLDLFLTKLPAERVHLNVC